jgi:hypothetical protein
MTLWLLSAVVLCALAVTERSLERFVFATTALAAIAATLLLIVPDFGKAVLLAELLAAAIVGASKVKYHHSGIKLTLADLPLAFAGTFWFLVAQYRRAAIGVLVGAGALIVAVIATLVSIDGSSAPFELRVTVFAVTVGTFSLSWRIGGAAAAFRQGVTERGGYFSTFLASCIDTASWRSSGGLSLRDISPVPLPLLADTPARTTSTPDIIVIQHESVFDPRLFGLAVEPNVAAFLSPDGGICGALNVDIYGGGSWRSELSLLTGLSSATFGPDAYFILQKGVDRFHHTLPHALAALGYKTMLTSSCRRSFLNYDAFYRSIGIGERIFADDFPPPFDVDRFEETNSDAAFLEAAVEVLVARMVRDPAPRFAYALTNFNHGPHDRQLVPPGHFAAERAFAHASLPDPHYVEYYTRLAETAASWRRMKSRLVALFPDRPMLIVHYGDHQPVMTRRIEQRLRLQESDRRQFRTFYAVEGLNFELDRSVLQQRDTLDIAFLGTIALQAAGLPLDRISTTRASLIEDCGEAYFASSSDRKRRFHRTLVDLGLIDVAPPHRIGYTNQVTVAAPASKVQERL